MSFIDLRSAAQSRNSRKIIASLAAVSIASAALVLAPSTSNAVVTGTRAFEEVYSGVVLGDFVSIGNSLTLTAPSPSVFADTDGDALTANSSTADLSLPAGATLEMARLDWMASTDSTSPSSLPASAIDAVARIKLPGETTYREVEPNLETLPSGAANPSYSTNAPTMAFDKVQDDWGTVDTVDDVNLWKASLDITSLLYSAGLPNFDGTYAVSVPFLSDGGKTAPEMSGWSMTVVYSMPTGTLGAKTRYIQMMDGIQVLDAGQNVAFSTPNNLRTPTSPEVKVGLVALGGDPKFEDYLKVSNTAANAATASSIVNALNPLASSTPAVTDIFNGTISTNGVDVATRSPGFAPSVDPATTPGTGFTAKYAPAGGQSLIFGNDYSSSFDLDIFNVSNAFAAIPSPTAVSVEFGSPTTPTTGLSSDRIYPTLSVVSVEVATPIVDVISTVTDLTTANIGARPGDILEVKVEASNIGTLGGHSSNLTVVIPNTLMYVADSMVLGSTTLNRGDGTPNDAADSDSASYNPATSTITWNLGAATGKLDDGTTDAVYLLAANAGDGVQEITFQVYVTSAAVNAQPIFGSLATSAISTLEPATATPQTDNNAFLVSNVQTADSTPRHDLSLTTGNVALEGTTANDGRLRFRVINNGPVNTLATVKWEYNNTDFTPNTSSISGATCTVSAVGTAATLSCAITSAVPFKGMSNEITVPLAFLKARNTLIPGKIWVEATGATQPDAADLSAGNNTLYEKTSGGASTWPAIPQAALFVVTADSYNVGHNTPLTVSAADGLLKNDTGAGLSVVSNTVAVMGSETTARGTLVVAANGSFTYTPTTDFAGTLTFTYGAKSTDYPTNSDGSERIDTGTVTLIVAARTDAVADTYYTPKGIELSVTVDRGMFSNDLGTPFTLTSLVGSNSATATVASNGSFTLTTTGGVIRGTKSDGSFIYTPTATFIGNDVFTYNATDAYGVVKTGTLTIEVLDAPVIVDDTIEATGGKINFDPLENDTGVGLTVTAFDATSKEGGTVVQEIDGSLTFTPKTAYFGTDSFTYTVTDAAGQTAVGTISIVIPEELAYTGAHVLAPLSAGWLLLVAAMMFFILSSRRMAPVITKA